MISVIRDRYYELAQHSADGRLVALRAGLQVVLRYPDAAGAMFRCVGFTGLPRVCPTLVEVAPGVPSTRNQATRLGQSIERAIRNLPGTKVADQMPCGGMGPFAGCHAWDEPECAKVVALVGDSLSPLSSPATVPSVPNIRFLPVLPRGTDLGSILPPGLSRINAATYTGDVIDVTQDVLAAAGLTTLDQRLFISYRRRETQLLADQLFDAFSHEGFDVFLDRFRVPTGVDFQARLEQELADKGMVLVLESQGIGLSHWVGREVAFARARRMGLVGLRLPRGEALPQIRASCRISLSQREIKGKGSAVRLESIGLRRVIASVKTLHAQALTHRHLILPRTMACALGLARARNVRVGAGGVVSAQPSNSARTTVYQISLTARSPELSDFHAAATSFGGPKRVLVGPCGSFELARRDRFDWLGGISQIEYRDEQEILALARAIASETI